MRNGRKPGPGKSEDRLAAYEAGKIDTEDFDVAMARLRKEFLG